MLDWQKHKVVCEVQVRETVKDVCFLHNNVFFAAAQRKEVYVYDKRGLEVHRMREHKDVEKLCFLPNHFLLSSIGMQGVLRYQDTSTGEIVAQHRTKLGPARQCLNPTTGWCFAATRRHGVVPNMTTPLVKMLCHRGPVNSLLSTRAGGTSSPSGRTSRWGVGRQDLQAPPRAFVAPAKSVEISQRGLVGIPGALGCRSGRSALQTKASAPYMNHQQSSGHIRQIRFCPTRMSWESGTRAALAPSWSRGNKTTTPLWPVRTRRGGREGARGALAAGQAAARHHRAGPAERWKHKARPKQVVAQKKEQQRAAAAAIVSKQRAKNESKQKMKTKQAHQEAPEEAAEHHQGQQGGGGGAGQAEDRAKPEGENVPSALKRFFKFKFFFSRFLLLVSPPALALGLPPPRRPCSQPFSCSASVSSLGRRPVSLLLPTPAPLFFSCSKDSFFASATRLLSSCSS